VATLAGDYFGNWPYSTAVRGPRHRSRVGHRVGGHRSAEFLGVLDQVPTVSHKLLVSMAARLREADTGVSTKEDGGASLGSIRVQRVWLPVARRLSALEELRGRQNRNWTSRNGVGIGIVAGGPCSSSAWSAGATGPRAYDQRRSPDQSGADGRFAQRKLLRRSIPGLATSSPSGLHNPDPHHHRGYGTSSPNLRHTAHRPWPGIGFLEDFFAVAVLWPLTTFSIIRIRNAPSRGTQEPFLRLHTGAAWIPC